MLFTEIKLLLEKQREYFRTGETQDHKFRIRQLKTLKSAIIKYEYEIYDALYIDLHKSNFEAYVTEIAFCLKSIDFAIKNLTKWSKPISIKSPFYMIGTKTYVQSEPLGSILIISPFNYPFQLAIEPLIGAIAAGNCAVIKPSENSTATAELLHKIITEVFRTEYISVVIGDKDTTASLIQNPFDYIFFTGSVAVGKIVMEACSKNLTPHTLELGGKSPCIVDKTADLKLAAERITWGKFMNAGQTCIAPDYLIVHQAIKSEFLKELSLAIRNFYGKRPHESNDYGRINNINQFKKLLKIINDDSQKIIEGGDYSEAELYVSPTIIDNCNWNDASMKEEIFGPILPVISFLTTEDITMTVNTDLHGKPLALYVFSENSHFYNKIIASIPFGGGCINDTISHITSPKVPFGGVGTSGIGSYHGKYSFDTFSHKKTILKRTTLHSFKFMYPPYEGKLTLVKKFLK